MGTRPIFHGEIRVRPHFSRGFTLLEVLVVTAIIAVMASFAVLSIGSRALDDRLDNEARRLKELLSLAADEATLQGVDLGFLQTRGGYAFLTLKDGKWSPAEAGPLREREMTEPFYLTLRIEGRAVAPYDPEDKKSELKPQVLLLSSGESMEFELAVRARDYKPHYVLEGDAMGRLALTRKDGAS
jgi:general secretion pathway protein H